MMMEEEIERTREEIRGIEEACEKVEEVLDGVVKGRGVSKDEEKEEEGKMEDVVLGEETNKMGSSGEQKWFERKELMDLWNGV
jgi:hypothetical protein